MEQPPTLETFPASLLSAVLGFLPNPGHVMRLVLTSRTLKLTVTESCDGYWEAQAVKAGWSLPRQATWTHQPQPPEAARPIEWFYYYQHRMNIRWRIRRFVNLYTPFLQRASQVAMNPGASLEQLKAAEARLEITLPWELFELHRQVNGQEAMSGVTFADSTRLLSLDELALEQVLLASPSIQQQLLEGTQSRLEELQIPPHIKHQQQQIQQAPSPHVDTGSATALRFAESGNGHQAFLLDLSSGAVLLRRGLTTFVTAPSVARFLQKLLT